METNTSTPSIDLLSFMNCYAVTIVNYHGPLRVVATDFITAYSKALEVISRWEGSEKIRSY